MARYRRAGRLGATTAAVAAVALLAACGTGGGSGDEDTGGDGDTGAGGDVTITWWHNSNNPPGRDVYEDLASEFEEANPGVTIEISAMAHEDMVTRLEAALQTGDAPDIFMERGGGELEAKVEAGLVRDLTEDAADTIATLGGTVAGWQVDERTYALPFSVGVVGFWYNTALFEDAGISGPPATLDDLYDAVDALEAIGIEPISVGAGDGWPAAHWWYYLALRQCSQDVLTQAIADRDFSDDCFLRAGETLEEIVAAEPFNAGFLATPAQEGPTSASGLLASGQVAMELAGHWEPGVMQGLTEDGQGLGDDTGWFPFPSLPDGDGDPAAALGGGDAWAVSEGAPDAAVDFVEFLLSDAAQQTFAENDMGLPTNPAASDAVASPVLADLLAFRDASPFVQLYLDTALGENIGNAMNDAIVAVFAGSGDAQDVVDAMSQAAARG